MPLPERPHLYLEEAREQLGLKPYDFWYYLGQGLLKAEVWVEHRCQYVERFDLDDAPKSWETLFTSFYAGYLIVPPVFCHALAAGVPVAVSRLYDGNPDCLRIPCSQRDGEEVQTPITIHRDALLIRKTEVQRFACEYGLGSEKTDVCAAPGRPSIMPEILAEHQRRARLHIAFKNNSHEARALRNWAAARFTSDTIPTQKTICNRLSELHQQWRKAAADERNNSSDRTKSVTVAA
jgi:hypothetical protein